MKNKKELALILSKLKTFEKPKVHLEQYQTDSEIAAEILWNVYLNNDITNKTIADLGCGTGILGLGALLLGAEKVYFVEIDKKAVGLAKENLKFIEKKINKKLKAHFINKDIKKFSKKVDIIIQNPPFGTKVAHKDKLFLLKGMSLAKVIYSVHKMSSINFIERLTREHGFKVKEIKKLELPIKRLFSFHKKKTYFVDIGFWKIENLN